MARQLSSPNSNIASEAQIYVMKHYHSVDKHAYILTQDVIYEDISWAF